MIELAMNTTTADTRIGSQSAITDTRHASPGRSAAAYCQRPIVLPSANFAAMNCPPGVPSFIGLTLTVTRSPGLKVVLRHPLRDSEFGLPPSMLHSFLTPLSSTTTWIQI